ncbi:MAG TPA: hypothetical protein PKL78_06505 [Anaerolineales bacterium]|nr:hypothetical protein [Anaerolineales bacterium]HNN13191.1 hypothetical protein [Anaerolineales bacterium]HNO30847.1 hypothetical protein [Anaerolineales bacterium]
MSKYQSSVVKKTQRKTKTPHYAWQGIGCIMMIIIPAISIAAAVETIQYGLNNNWPIPYQLLGNPQLPDLFYKSQGIMMVLGPIVAIRHFYAYVVVSMLYMILFGGVSSLAYALVYRAANPSQYNPMDVPPPSIKLKKYKR